MKTLERECTVDYFTGRGSGGQHRNRHYCCVRLHHPPSGITVVATEHRSQYRNRKLAFKQVAARLKELNRDRRARVPTAVPRSVKDRIRERNIRHARKKSLRKKIGTD